jgi:uncharacterized surface protein with fasciclin (FAS1) repeats
MTPNTLRIAFGLVVFGAAPLGLATFPQQALSDAHTSQVEQPAATDMAPKPEMTAPEPEMMAPEADSTDPESDLQTSSEMTIADIAAGDENFEILAAALETAELTEALGNEDISITVFAPTDEAFESLPEGALEALLLPENRDQLVQLLTYHVVDGAVRSTDLSSGEVSTLSGAPITVTVGDEMVMINQANVLMADIEASNGVIHVIDSVLLPM